MALAATLKEVWDDGHRLHAKYTIVASGSYVLGGDTLNLAAGDLPVQGVPDDVKIHGRAGFIYEYIPGANITNGKMMAFVNTAGGVNTALGEHTAVAYVAGITGDTIIAEAVFKKAA